MKFEASIPTVALEGWSIDQTCWRDLYKCWETLYKCFAHLAGLQKVTLPYFLFLGARKLPTSMKFEASVPTVALEKGGAWTKNIGLSSKQLRSEETLHNCLSHLVGL